MRAIFAYAGIARAGGSLDWVFGNERILLRE